MADVPELKVPFRLIPVSTEGAELQRPVKTGCLPGTFDQPEPRQDNPAPASWDLVKQDIEARNAEGIRKYGVPLKPGNGRDTLVDAYQEALDLVVYLRTAIYERDGK